MKYLHSCLVRPLVYPNDSLALSPQIPIYIVDTRTVGSVLSKNISNAVSFAKDTRITQGPRNPDSRPLGGGFIEGWVPGKLTGFARLV